MRKYGQFLKEIRKENNLSLLELQKKTGISNQNLSRWERDEVLPNIEFCEILADFYNISIDELIGRKRKNNLYINQSQNNGTINNNF